VALPLPFPEVLCHTGVPAGEATRIVSAGGFGIMKVRVSLVAVIAMLATLATSALAQDRRDVRLAEDIGRSITTYARLTIFDDINATVENGMVALTGKVTMPFKKDDIEKRISKIDGVRGMRSDISVLPVSQFDDELRYRVSRAIYSNPSFWNYAAMANPPIHIIVEGGHVTLAGVVNSNVERMLARSLATGLGELSVTNALKTDAEVRSE
jgi:hyperosmotically inducible periplasmic protein